MAQAYVVKAPVVKVAVGPASGNRVARFIHRGGFVPEGVEQELLDNLEGRKLIEKVPAEAPGPDPETVAAAAAAKAAQDAKDREAAEKAAADKAAAEKAAADKAAADKAAVDKAAASKTPGK